MKVYINLETLTIIKVDREKPFYQGSNFVDKIRILFDKSLDPASTPTITFRLPTGRRKGPIYAIGIDAGSTRLITEDGQEWFYYDFILSAETGVLTYPGQLEASIVLNYFNYDGAITKQAVTGTVVNEIVKTTVYENGNIIVVGDNPEEIINDFYAVITATANKQTSLESKQTSLETAWEHIDKWMPIVIESNLTTTENKIEFNEDGIIIKLRGKASAAFDAEEETFDVNGDVSAKSFKASSTSAPSTFHQVEADDVKIGASKESVKDSISNLKALLKVIKNLQEEVDNSEIRFTDGSIVVTHSGTDIARFSFEEIKFLDDVEFDKGIIVKNDVVIEQDAIVHNNIYANQPGTTAHFNNGDFANNVTIDKDVNIHGTINNDQNDNSAYFYDCFISGVLKVQDKDILALILDRYTKSEVNELLSRIPKFKTEVVNTLPATNIDPYTIYLVPNGLEDSDAHIEYLYINGKWEPIGITRVDLSNYYTKLENYNKTEIDAKFTATDAELNEIIEGAWA